MNPSRLAVLAAMLLALPAAAQSPAAPAAETVSVHGTGRAELTPDRAVFTVGVQTMAPTVAAAVQESNARASAIIAALKRLGAADRDIRTSQVSIYPQQEQTAGRAPKIAGYQVSNSITVSREDPAAVGKFLQAAVDAGANSVSGVGFTVSDPARGRDAALQAAFADARAKAEILARAAGRSLGRALNIVEGGAVRPPVPMQYEKLALGRSADVPIEAGTEEVSFGVSVVFELR
ncbi:MAG TPA: SIMPL domain-containing protein [Vicinamibacteria bacterium]|jgi:hypothetical protein